MKKLLLRLAIFWAGLIWIITINTSTVSAQDNDCNKFGWTCYVSKVWVIKTDEWPAPTLLTTIKRTINVILALLATIATLICIYAWFKMLTSGWDSKWYDDGLKILKNAAIGLAIIGLSWIIVSAVLRFVDTATEWKSIVESSTQ